VQSVTATTSLTEPLKFVDNIVDCAGDSQQIGEFFCVAALGISRV
jgi:hypothetical protein